MRTSSCEAYPSHRQFKRFRGRRSLGCGGRLNRPEPHDYIAAGAGNIAGIGVVRRREQHPAIARDDIADTVGETCVRLRG